MAGGRWAMVVGVGCGGADGRVWSRSNDGEESPHPSVGGGGEVVGVRREAVEEGLLVRRFWV